jgi:hypothetical protein
VTITRHLPPQPPSNDTLTSLESTLLSSLLGEVAVAEAVKHSRIDITVMVHPGPVSVGLVLYDGMSRRRVASSLSTNIIRAARDPDHLREMLYNGVCLLMNQLLDTEGESAYRLRKERNELLRQER